MANGTALPAGWVHASVDELCELNPKHSKELLDNLPVTFIPMAAVDEVRGRISEYETRTLGDVRRGYTHFSDGDVLLAKITPCMENGKAAIARGLTNSIGCGTTEFFVLRSKGAIAAEYLHQFVRQQRFRDEARSKMKSGVGQARVPKDFLLGKQLPVPPLAEQRRIVAKVEALQERTRASRTALESVGPLLDQFRRSLLAAAFRGDLTADWREQNPDVEPASELLARILGNGTENPDVELRGETGSLPPTWRYCRMDSIASVQLGQRRAPEYRDCETRPYLRAANITWDGLDLSDIKTMGVGNPDQVSLEPGDLVLNEASGSRAEVGKPAIWDGEIADCCFQATVIRLRPRFNEIGSRWMYLHCLRDALFGAYGRDTPGLGVLHLTAKLMRSWRVPVAPETEQREIGRRVTVALESLSTVVASTSEIQDSVALSESSLLSKAFRGELVPQDPSDEPASVLLERIRAEREAAKPVKKRGGRKSAAKRGSSKLAATTASQPSTGRLKTGETRRWVLAIVGTLGTVSRTMVAEVLLRIAEPNPESIETAIQYLARPSVEKLIYVGESSVAIGQKAGLDAEPVSEAERELIIAAVDHLRKELDGQEAAEIAGGPHEPKVEGDRSEPDAVRVVSGAAAADD